MAVGCRGEVGDDVVSEWMGHQREKGKSCQRCVPRISSSRMPYSLAMLIFSARIGFAEFIVFFELVEPPIIASLRKSVKTRSRVETPLSCTTGLTAHWFARSRCAKKS